MLFDERGRTVATAQHEHRQITPRPGWVEHDADEILARSRACIDEALAAAGARAADVAAIGIANQRETVVLWERESGRPLANAIVWQDTRSAERVAALGSIDRFRAQTGLPLATYFSGPKLSWLLDELPGARGPRRGRRAGRGHDRQLAGLAPGRRARDRRDQREPHAADGPGHARRGTTACSTRSASRARCWPASGRRAASSARSAASRWPRCSAISRRRSSGSAASRPARPSAPTARATSSCSTPASAACRRATA